MLRHANLLRPRIAGERTRRSALCLLAILLSAAGCSLSPLAPDNPETAPSPPPEVATISGWVYENVTWGDPPVPYARIEVRSADGSTTAAVSDRRGFYQLSVRSGDVSITTSKQGHETRRCQVTLLTDMVLNFFLAPM